VRKRRCQLSAWGGPDRRLTAWRRPGAALSWPLYSVTVELQPFVDKYMVTTCSTRTRGLCGLVRHRRRARSTRLSCLRRLALLHVIPLRAPRSANDLVEESETQRPCPARSERCLGKRSSVRANQDDCPGCSESSEKENEHISHLHREPLMARGRSRDRHRLAFLAGVQMHQVGRRAKLNSVNCSAQFVSGDADQATDLRRHRVAG
jgi:hypothetical protein